MKITQNKNWYLIKSAVPKCLYDPLLQLYYKITRLVYLGSRLYCPICQKSHGKFRSKGCPNCGSFVRQRVLWLFLKRKTNFFSANLRVLHFAPELFFYRRFRNLENLDYLSADPCSPRAMIKVDMEKIQFQDNSFDVVISSHVLEHVNDDIRAMKELCRVQKPGGWSIHLVPIVYSRSTTYEDPAIVKPEARTQYYGCFDHKRAYGTDYKNRLESAGFEVEIIRAEEFCTGEEIERMCLDGEFEIYYCKKPASGE